MNTMNIMTTLKQYTYMDPKSKEWSNETYNKISPLVCAKAIFKKILQLFKGQYTELKLIIKDIETDKVFYYRCLAYYNPVFKQVSKNKDKYIEIKYETAITKIPEKHFKIMEMIEEYKEQQKKGNGFY